MFRRKPEPPDSSGDPLLTADLPVRVQTAETRLAHQHNPALREAWSERELVAERGVAERIREHDRTEKIAEIEALEATAEIVRKTTTEIVHSEARDLAMAQRALADQRREGSPHAQLAQLYRVKKWSGRALAGVVLGAMLYSATNVQHNLAPGGPSEPLYWASYLLEALISVVLVVFMLSGAAVTRWKIVEGEDTIRRIEVALLAGSILLNVYPYLRSPQDWIAVGVHSAAPIMMGIALFGHTAVAKRMGAAIAKASLELPPADDTTERLQALRARAEQPAPARATAADRPDEDVLADYERELAEPVSRAEDPTMPMSLAREPIVARATETVDDVARDAADRASIAREESEVSRAESTESRASEDVSPIARDSDPAEPLEHELAAIQAEHTAARAQADDRASRAAHNPAELDTDHEPIAAREDDSTPVAREDSEDVAREDSEDVARDLTPVVALVRPSVPARATRETAARSSRANHASIARETAVDGALARATERAPRATSRARDNAGVGPFARELTPGDASRLARAVLDRNKSKQPVEVLTKIYLAKSQGMTNNHIGDTIGLPHSTVGRAVDAAIAVSGPRSVD
ncbi:hypothetical protein ACWIGW_45495 [Nocardia brasiliensis]